MTTAALNAPIYDTDHSYGAYPQYIPGGVHGLTKWKLHLIDILARANGCRVQVLPVKQTGVNNVIVYGREDMATRALAMLHGAHGVIPVAHKAVCASMHDHGVRVTDAPYAQSFLVGFVARLEDELQGQIASQQDEVNEIGAAFPQLLNATIPQQKVVDDVVHDRGYAAAGHATFGKATVTPKAPKNVTPAATVTVVPAAPQPIAAAPVTLALPAPKAKRVRKPKAATKLPKAA